MAVDSLRRSCTAVIIGLFAAADVEPAHAQLRPVDPLEWSVFGEGAGGGAALGVESFAGQRASLAGVEGRLWEVGTLRLWWRHGRVALTASGTALRVLDDPVAYATPHGGTERRPGPLRDAGDFTVGTAVRLLDRAGTTTFLRFGTRLPTTDNRVGLERDRTDFFALVGTAFHPLGATAVLEAGVGILGTRYEELEQSDVLLYAVQLHRPFGAVHPRLVLVGQVDGLHSTVLRGNEDLQEARFDLRVGSERWIEAGVVKGFRRFSPELGLRLAVGARFGGRRVSPAPP